MDTDSHSIRFEGSLLPLQPKHYESKEFEFNTTTIRQCNSNSIVCTMLNTHKLHAPTDTNWVTVTIKCVISMMSQRGPGNVALLHLSHSSGNATISTQLLPRCWWVQSAHSKSESCDNVQQVHGWIIKLAMKWCNSLQMNDPTGWCTNVNSNPQSMHTRHKTH